MTWRTAPMLRGVSWRVAVFNCLLGVAALGACVGLVVSLDKGEPDLYVCEGQCGAPPEWCNE